MKENAVNWKLFWNAAGLCVPTALLVAFGAWFLAVEVPKIQENERERVLAVSERKAKEARDDPSLATFTWERRKGVVSGTAEDAAEYKPDRSWKEWEPASGTKRKDMWGWSPLPGGGRRVWARALGKSSDVVYLRDTDIEERDWRLLVNVFVVSLLVVLVAMTWVGVRYFCEYVRSRDDFMSATAHDLATPLVAMRNLIGSDDGEARALNERLLRIVRNVRDFMRLGGRRRPPERETFDLLAAYREAYALFREDYRDLFGGEDVELDLSAFAGGALPAALGDETMTVQIIWNLLGNDLKYAAPFGRVRVKVSAEGGFLSMDFIDEGKGMTPREMARAFDRYYRAKTILESGKGGFGIGLCTSREFAEAMGGALSVRANKPRGCVFTLRLPRADLV